MKGLDLKHFKKIKSDGNSTVFRDKSGHELKVAHKGLSDRRKKEMEAIPFADGGEVEEPDWKDSVSSGKKFGISEDKLKAIREFKAPEEQRAISSVPGAEEITGPIKPAEEPKGILQGAIDSVFSKDPEKVARNQWKQGIAKDQSAAASPMRGPAPASIAPAQEAMAQPQVAGLDQGMAQGLIGQFQSGVNAEANAIGQQAKAQQDVYKQQANDQQKLLADFNQKSQQAMQEVGAVMEDYKKQYINPNHYQESQSTGQKVMTAIGLILGGMGAGITGGENTAARFLTDQINRDIEAQKANLGKTNSILSFNMQKYGNMRDAVAMTEAMQKGIYATKLEEAANKSKDPMARARGMQLAAQFKASILPTVTKLAQSQTLQSVLAAPANTEGQFRQKLNVLRSASPEHAKDLEEKFIPGYGVASVKPSEKDKEALTSMKEMKRGLTELQSRAVTIGTTVPGSQADRENKALQTSVMLNAKNAFDLGVLAGPDMDLLRDVIPNPGSWMTKGTIAQLDKTKKSIDARERAITQKLGITPFQASNPMEGRTATDAQGNRIVMQNGKWVRHGG